MTRFSLDFIRRLPVSSFGVCLGIVGQVPMWTHLAHSPTMSRFNIPSGAAEAFWVIAVIIFSLFMFLHAIRLIRFHRSVRTEFHCYYQSNFFLIPILCLLLICATVPKKWLHGGVLSTWVLLLLIPLLMLEIYLYGEWMYGVNRSLRTANPAFQLSVVGNFMGALLASGVGQDQLADGLFAVGCVYLGIVLTCIHSGDMRVKRNVDGDAFEEELRRRMVKLDADAHPVLPQSVGRVQHNPWSVKSEIWALPPGLQPTLFLCIAPPAVAALARVARNKGTCDRFCQDLTFISMFFLLTMTIHLHRFFRRTPFSLAIWAFTFPSATLASASIEVAEESGAVLMWIAFLLSLFAIVIFSLAVIVTVYQGFQNGVSAFLSAGSEATDDIHYMNRGEPNRVTDTFQYLTNLSRRPSSGTTHTNVQATEAEAL